MTGRELRAQRMAYIAMQKRASSRQRGYSARRRRRARKGGGRPAFREDA